MTKKTLMALTAAAAIPFAFAATEWDEMPLPEGTYFDAESEYRSEVFEIPVAAHSALEFKLALEEGQVLVYEWSAEGGEEGALSTEFHGHTEPVDGMGKLMFYNIHEERQESGALVAPFSGIHGWYLNNQGSEEIVVTLTASGFFEEVE